MFHISLFVGALLSPAEVTSYAGEITAKFKKINQEGDGEWSMLLQITPPTYF